VIVLPKVPLVINQRNACVASALGPQGLQWFTVGKVQAVGSRLARERRVRLCAPESRAWQPSI
jgi:hypothetical protein